MTRKLKITVEEAQQITNGCIEAAKLCGIPMTSKENLSSSKEKDTD